MNPRLNIRVYVDDREGNQVVSYVFDLNDFAQRRVFAEQMQNAYIAGQVATTCAEDWTPETGHRLRVVMASRWLTDHEIPADPLAETARRVLDFLDRNSEP